MKANRAPRGLADDAGVSPVVAAVLLFALFSTGFLVWSTTQLPEWIADREQAHASEVQRRFATIRSDLESLSAQGESGPLGTSVALAPAAVPLLQSSPASGRLGYEPGFSVAYALQNTGIHQQGATTPGNPDEDIDGDLLTGVSDLRRLTLGLTSIGVDPSELGFIRAVATAGAETVTATWAHRGYAYPDSAHAGPTSCDTTTLRTEMHLRVESDVTGILFDETLACDFGTDVGTGTPRRLDLMASEYGFSSALERLGDGATVTLTDGVLGGTATVTGRAAAVWTDTAGRDRVLGSGLAAGTVTATQSGGALEYRLSPREFHVQAVAWEGGAIILGQPDGAVMTSDPGFGLSSEGTTGFLRWTVVELTGSGAVSGVDAATATVTHVSTSDVVYSTDDASFTVTSDHAAAWRQFWAERQATAGIADATVGGSGTAATLDLTTATDITQWIIHIRHIAGIVDVT